MAIRKGRRKGQRESTTQMARKRNHLIKRSLAKRRRESQFHQERKKLNKKEDREEDQGSLNKLIQRFNRNRIRKSKVK